MKFCQSLSNLLLGVGIGLLACAAQVETTYGLDDPGGGTEPCHATLCNNCTRVLLNCNGDCATTGIYCTGCDGACHLAGMNCLCKAPDP